MPGLKRKLSVREASNVIVSAAKKTRKSSSLRRRSNVEVKGRSRTLALTSASAAAGSVVTGLTLVPEGSDYNERIGRKVQVRNLKLRFHCSGTGRFIIFMDKSPNGVLPSITDVLDNSSVATLAYAPINPFNNERFVILKDQMIADSALGNSSKVFDVYLPSKGGVTSYVQTTVSEGAAGTNHYYIWMGAIDASADTLTGSSQFRYQDL